MIETSAHPYTNPFHSFWMAGYECADHLNAFGNRVDFLDITAHRTLMDQDYKDLLPFNMSTVREGICWSQVEKIPYQYDWTFVAITIAVGKRHNIQQLWDICHFGFPDDLTPLHPQFAKRFASLCKAFVNFYRSVDTSSVLIITPINEVSFLSWLGGDVRGTSPYCVGQGWEVKYRLMKAYIEGIEAIKEADPSVRILTTEPLINIVPPPQASEQQIEWTVSMNNDQFQVTDILSGRICPELRGKPEYLDILGYNYYYDNQWILHTREFIPWRTRKEGDGFIPLHQLLKAAYERYDCPMVLTETSHPKEDRPVWIDMIAAEVRLAFAIDLPLWGVCWYPIIDRPDWDDLTTWHYSGIWQGDSSNPTARNLHQPSAQALLRVQDSKLSAL